MKSTHTTVGTVYILPQLNLTMAKTHHVSDKDCTHYCSIPAFQTPVVAMINLFLANGAAADGS
jgi:hypothetical protein